MSRQAPKKIKRSELLAKFWDLGRKMSTQTVFLHQAIAQEFGLNATDTKCVDLILGGAESTVTAGWLAQRSGLTTGAITHILDRLEKRGFIERVRDTQDRRKVFVRVRPDSLKALVPKYEVIGEAFLSLLSKYDDAQLALICEYLERTSEMAERELLRITSGRRSQRERE
jgi:DNA-binding MarR family transcriptional regulator